jgi:hypothetical protein
MLVRDLRRHCHLGDRRPIAARLSRGVGRIGAALALAVQLLLPFVAMPQRAFASVLEAQNSALLAQATAAWGPDALCTLSGATRHTDKDAPSDHPCPICWTVQQAASLPPPAVPPLPPAPIELRLQPVIALIGPFVQASRPPSPPRGPPLV